MGWKGVGLVVEGREIVVAGRFRQLETLKNGRLLRGEAGALGHGSVADVVGVELDPVELGRQVPPGVAGGDLGGADQQQRKPAQLHVSDDPLCVRVRRDTWCSDHHSQGEKDHRLSGAT